MFCQVFNNAETRSDVTFIQSAALVMKLICLLLMITEIIMMMWEVTKNKDQRKLGIPGFEELSEEQRRMQNHKRMSCVGYISMFIFIVLLALVGLLSKGRECGP
jgi:ABC-type Fe3+ transport system permease subunit